MGGAAKGTPRNWWTFAGAEGIVVVVPMIRPPSIVAVGVVAEALVRVIIPSRVAGR